MQEKLKTVKFALTEACAKSAASAFARVKMT
jgi:hypothetical protein